MLMKLLTPHSDEWFEALGRISPQQAAITKRFISLAGNVNVCGTCGDDPAKDYEVVGVAFNPGTPATIRLCDDCKSICQKMHGDRYNPI
jgi:hypothetical protein